MEIAIVGSGSGVVMAAIDMVNKGHDVKLYCYSQSMSKFQNVIRKGGFDFNNEGDKHFVEFTDISDDMEYVLKGAEVVQVIIPSSYIEYYADVTAEHVTDNQLIFFNMAVAMGSIHFMNVLEDRHIETRPQLAGVNTPTYGTRTDFENAAVDLSLNVCRVFFSTYDRSYLGDYYDKTSGIYDHLVRRESLIKTDLENDNPEVHPGPTLLNVGRIDYAGKSTLYKEGITKHTVRLLHTIELERLNLGRRLSFELSTAKESRIEHDYLGRDEEDEPLNRLFNTSPAFSQTPGPSHVESRYLTEDITYGLVLWSSLGRIIDVPTPNIDAVIVIASTILERNFFEEGLAVEEIGLGKLDLEKYLE